MGTIFGIIITIIKVVFLLGFLIIIHEGGHFLVAKKSNIKVQEFSIGFGPLIYKKQGKETLYTVRLIPLGGFVQMEGEIQKTDDPRAFTNARLRNRMAVILAGPLVNIIFALIVYFTLALFTGYNVSSIVGGKLEECKSNLTQIEIGDQIIKIDNHNIRTKGDITKALAGSDGTPVSVTVLRNNEKMTFSIIPTEYQENYYILGVQVSLANNDLKTRAYYVFYESIDFVTSTVEMFGKLFTGGVKVEQMAGPIGISGIVADTDELFDFIDLIAIVSMSLGFTNLLPIPVLDGGRFLILVIEGIRGKALKEEVELKIESICFMLLILFSLYVAYNDILRLI